MVLVNRYSKKLNRLTLLVFFSSLTLTGCYDSSPLKRIDTPSAQTTTSSGPVVSQASLQELTQTIEDKNEVMKTHSFGISSKLSQEGAPAISAQVGLGNIEAKTPMPADAQFRIGSVTKSFTATVLLQLEAEGKINIDDKVEKWLPGLLHNNGYNGNDISVKQLLNHTSGIADYTGTAALAGAAMVTPDDLINVALASPPMFAPGSQWKYSNTNYVLLGKIIEKVSGHSWQEELQNRIFKPLKLELTYIPAAEDINVPANAAQGYNFYNGNVVNTTAQNMSWAWSIGNIISTQDDVATFFRSLVQGKLLPEKQWKEMTSTVQTTGYDWSKEYGLGLMHNTTSCGKGYYGHTGSVQGYQTRIAVPEDGKKAFVSYYNVLNENDNTLTTPAYHEAIDKIMCQ